MKNKIFKILPVFIILLSIYSVIPYPKFESSIFIIINNTVVWWIVKALIIIGHLYIKNTSTDKAQRKQMFWINIYIYWNVIEIIYGFFVAETYWDWKGLIDNIMILLMPLVALACTNPQFVQNIMRVYLKHSLPLFVLVVLFLTPGAYGFYLIPISLILFFLKFIDIKWKVLFISLSIFVLLADLDARSNVIKFAAPLLLVISIPLVRNIKLNILNAVRRVLLISPYVLFFLAISSTFNIFKLDEYIEGDYKEIRANSKGELVETNLTADTRTALYEEVLSTASKYNTWITGRSPARGNETELFSSLSEVTGRNERLSNEVAILNIFSWTGVVGVFIYFMIFCKASYLSLIKSNNVYSKIIALFLAFRWVYAWVEDINNFSLNYYFVWLLIGFCYSNSFRMMTDQDIKYWVKGIFNKQYRKFLFKPHSISYDQSSSFNNML